MLLASPPLMATTDEIGGRAKSCSNQKCKQRIRLPLAVQRERPGEARRSQAINSRRQRPSTKLGGQILRNRKPAQKRVCRRSIIMRLLHPHIRRGHSTYRPRWKPAYRRTRIHAKVAKNRGWSSVGHRRTTQHSKASRLAKIDSCGLSLKRESANASSREQEQCLKFHFASLWQKVWLPFPGAQTMNYL